VCRNKLVSIIVPVYNSEKYVDKCINSILNQTYKNIELILIDDGSIDNSGHLCDVYANVDRRVKVIHMKNSGVSSARNKGIEAARGKFIQFVDSDDYIEKNMVETLVHEINNNVDIVLCGYKRLTKDNNRIINAKNSNLYKQVSITKEMFLNQFDNFYKNQYINYLWNKLYFSSIIKKNGIEFDNSIDWGEDLMFNLEYLGYCNNITIIDKLLYNYINYNNDSITSKFNSELYNNQQNMYKKVREFLKSNNKYLGENKQVVERKFTDAIVMCLSNLFYKNSNYNKIEIINKISEIIEDDVVREDLKYFADGSISKKMIGKLIGHKSLKSIYYYFQITDYIRDIISFLSRLLIKICRAFKIRII